MTLKQRFLKLAYPIWMLMAGSKKKEEQIQRNQFNQLPPVSFYSLTALLNNGKELPFSNLKDKKVLLVNTASNCGFTNQYEELEKLNLQNQGKLIVLGFPANDFKEQEKGTDEEIAKFCSTHFNISFPLMQKSIVQKEPGQNKVFEWLSNASKNGWNNKAPGWNFSKYLVNENGILTHRFGPAVSPLSKDLLKAIG